MAMIVSDETASNRNSFSSAWHGCGSSGYCLRGTIVSLARRSVDKHLDNSGRGPDSLGPPNKLHTFGALAYSNQGVIRRGISQCSGSQQANRWRATGRRVSRLTCRANARVLLGDGSSSQEVVDAVLSDDDGIRTWQKLPEQRGSEPSEFDIHGDSGV
jgi:hypothetical protein